MRFIIEIEGVLADLTLAYHRAHVAAAAEAGWSAMDQSRFWRTLRKLGRGADFLPGAKPLKSQQYREAFERYIKSPESIDQWVLHDGNGSNLKSLANYGACCLVTSGRDLAARAGWLHDHRLGRFSDRTEALSDDPRRRPGELLSMATGDERCVVVAADDALVRAAGQAGLLTVGVTSGACNAQRLHQAGADVVYKSLTELPESLRRGAPDLVRAGLLPLPLG